MRLTLMLTSMIALLAACTGSGAAPERTIKRRCASGSCSERPRRQSRSIRDSLHP